MLIAMGLTKEECDSMLIAQGIEIPWDINVYIRDILIALDNNSKKSGGKGTLPTINKHEFEFKHLAYTAELLGQECVEEVDFHFAVFKALGNAITQTLMSNGLVTGPTWTFESAYTDTYYSDTDDWGVVTFVVETEGLNHADEPNTPTTNKFRFG